MPISLRVRPYEGVRIADNILIQARPRNPEASAKSIIVTVDAPREILVRFLKEHDVLRHLEALSDDLLPGSTEDGD